MCELRGKILNDTTEIENQLSFIISNLIAWGKEDDYRLRNLLHDFIIELTAFEKRKLLMQLCEYLSVKVPKKKLEDFFRIRNKVAHSLVLFAGPAPNKLKPVIFLSRKANVIINKNLFREFVSLREDLYSFMAKLSKNSK